MKWKMIALAACLVASSCFSVGAYDISQLAAKTLPKGFTYKEIEEPQSVSFWGQEVPYQMGQLQVTLKKQQAFSSGYIIRTKLPDSMEKGLRPFFRLNRDEKVWKILNQMNRALWNEESPLRKNIESTMKTLAVNALGPIAEKDVKVSISDIEPMRRLSADEAYVYTAGGVITFDSGGLLLPMYCRTYFFPGDHGLDVLMLFTPNEGKGPLVYAIDDLAQAAATESILGREGYRNLGEILGEQESSSQI